MTALAELESTIQTAAEKVGPAVVGLGRGWGLGTGVVVATGRVLTNAHNLRGDEATVTFAGGRRETGRVAGVDLDVDLAAIEVDTGDVEPVAWDPEAGPPALGTAVLALANPGGRGLRVTTGFVSSAERRFRGPRGRRIAGAIEHTAPLPRGSSGGPLVDSEGRLLGLNTIRQEGGLILAIPADAGLARRADALWRGEPAQRGRLGVAIAPPRGPWTRRPWTPTRARSPGWPTGWRPPSPTSGSCAGRAAGSCPPAPAAASSSRQTASSSPRRTWWPARGARAGGRRSPTAARSASRWWAPIPSPTSPCSAPTPAISRPPSWATPRRCASASWWWRSATPTAL